MQGREAKSVTWIQPIFGKVAPGSYMTGNQETRNVNAGDAATNAVGIKNRLAEELLSSPHANCCLRFCGPGRWNESAPLQSHFVTLEEIHFIHFVFGEQVVEQFFTFRC